MDNVVALKVTGLALRCLRVNRSSVSWDDTVGPITALGRWRVGVLFEPAHGEAPGGDRFGLRTSSSGLAFYLADATGHGKRGAQFWERLGGFFCDVWEPFASNPSESSLVGFASDLNDTLHGRSLDGEQASLSQLCLAAGWLSPGGALVFATFGLGVHVVPTTAAGRWRIRPERRFGFRLGWVSSIDWAQFEQALVIHRVSNPQRLWFASDAFFGDDHTDPEATFQRVSDLDHAIAGLTIEDALSDVGLVPHSGDDATFVLLEAI